MPNSCPINVGERLRIVAAVPLIKNREIHQTKLELYDLELDLYAHIYHFQVDAPMGSLHPDH